MNGLTVLLTEEQMEDLANRIAAKLGGPQTNKPYSLTEAARVLGVSSEAVRLRVHAGLIRSVPGMGRRVLIPRTEIERIQTAEKKP